MGNDLSLYNKSRSQLKTGDAILWRSDTLLGKIIQWKSDSPLNHVSIVIRFDEYAKDRVYVLEALEHGTVLYPLSARLNTHDGKAWAYQIHWNLEDVRQDMGRYALENAGKPYDYKGLLGNIFGRVKGDDKALFCSEYWFRAFKYGVAQKCRGYDQLRRIEAYLDNEMPRPSDFPMMVKAGVFGKVVDIL